MRTYILDFRAIDRTQVSQVGGKGATLGELSRIGGIRVPDGFCITTAAFGRIIAETPAVEILLEELSQLEAADRTGIARLSAEIRSLIEEAAVPPDITEAIRRQLSQSDPGTAWAVRSSATAEDLPTASFAGQQDTYLNVTGEQAVLQHIGKCWASLFTERAVVYRLQNGFDHRKVQLSVIVQKMVFPEASGILFTADPVTSDRKTVSIDAGFGLGEALVSGLVSADNYKVRDGRIADQQIAAKRLAIRPLKTGGTQQETIAPEQQHLPVLTDRQILDLERIGRQIEAHFGSPQDIEWCLADGELHIVQSRPITTLYPIPEADDAENRVYISVGHQQMMTDAMKPLGLSFYQMTTPAPMRIAGGRLFVDVTAILASPAQRQLFFNMLGQYEPLIKNALSTVVERDFIRTVPDAEPDKPKSPLAWSAMELPENDPAIVAGLIEKNRASVEALKENIRLHSGPALFGFIREDIAELKRLLADPQTIAAIKAGMEAFNWINEHAFAWLGEQNAADTLAQSVPNNVTSEMGLALLEVADVIRPFPEVIAVLQQVKDTFSPEELIGLNGATAACDAINDYLAVYGMRCPGEIDLTKTRWSENPAALVPLILGNVRNFEPGAGKRLFEQGLQEALQKERELLRQLRQLPDGEQKAAEMQEKIAAIRTFAGYREYPKYGMVSRYFIYKQALLAEGERLVRSGILSERADIFYLSFDELEAVVRDQVADEALILQREEAFRAYSKLSPPRVLTSDGETLSGVIKREHLPAGALAGLPVSAGIVEGRARVILNMETADLEEGDILVTAFTDPSWTPLFVSIKGLVTEVGGLMTHGAVIAREYGLPAVVGVENATKSIRDGQRIRVNGMEGIVEVI